MGNSQTTALPKWEFPSFSVHPTLYISLCRSIDPKKVYLALGQRNSKGGPKGVPRIPKGPTTRSQPGLETLEIRGTPFVCITPSESGLLERASNLAVDHKIGDQTLFNYPCAEHPCFLSLLLQWLFDLTHVMAPFRDTGLSLFLVWFYSQIIYMYMLRPYPRLMRMIFKSCVWRGVTTNPCMLQ